MAIRVYTDHGRPSGGVAASRSVHPGRSGADRDEVEGSTGVPSRTGYGPSRGGAYAAKRRWREPNDTEGAQHVNATAATAAHSSKGTARTAVIALAFVVGAAVAGLATGTVIQQVTESRATAYWPAQPLAHHTPSWFASSALPVKPLGAALALEAYGTQHIERMGIAVPAVADQLVSDTFRFTGPSRIQAVAGLSPALALEAYGQQHIEHMAAAAAAATEARLAPALALEAYGRQHIEHMAAAAAAGEPLSDTFRFTGGSRPE
jgi:hypothetical protein